MQVSHALLEGRANVRLPSGEPTEPTEAIVRDRWRRLAMFMPCSVRRCVVWDRSDKGTALRQLKVPQTPTPFEDAQRVVHKQPGAHLPPRVAHRTHESLQ